MTLPTRLSALVLGILIAVGPVALRGEDEGAGELLLDEAPAAEQTVAEGTSEETVTVIDYDSPMQFGLDLQYLTRKYENYQFADGVGTTSQPTAIRINFEWIPLQRYGKTGVGVTTGFSYLANTYLGPDPADPTSDGIFASLYTVPVGIYVTYRADFIKDQILVPFGKFGFNLAIVKQNSVTGGSKDLATYKGLEFGGGLELCLDPLERSAERGMEQGFGINSTYFVFEYIVAQNLSAGTQPDLSGVEYRGGLRFEF